MVFEALEFVFLDMKVSDTVLPSREGRNLHIIGVRRNFHDMKSWISCGPIPLHLGYVR